MTQKWRWRGSQRCCCRRGVGCMRGAGRSSMSADLGKRSLAGSRSPREGGPEEGERSSVGKKTAFPLAGLAFGGGGTSPMKARGWMGGPLGYSQPWKSLVCSHDANCLQPDTFLDLAEREEMRVRHLEAPPIPTSLLSKRGWGPIMCALRENCSRPAQDAWVCQVAGVSGFRVVRRRLHSRARVV